METPTAETPNTPIHGDKRYPPIPQSNAREMVRNPLSFFTSITRQYGDIVCYRPAPDTAYVLNHPDYIRHVLVENHHNYSKATYSNQIFKKVVGDGLITAEGDAWLRQRRLMQPAFHHSRIQHLDGLIVQATEEMLGRWEVHCARGEAVDIAREMAALTLTVTARALFGVNLGEPVNAIGEIVNRAALLFEKPSHPALRQSAQQFRAVVDEIVRERKRDFRDTGDLLSSLILARDESSGQGLSDAQLGEQLCGLLLAGYETTANALTWTWYLLSQHPWAAERLQEEARLALGGRSPTHTDLERMPFLRQTLDESLRLYPPAWILGRRAIGEDEIGGYYTPPGTVVAICIYTLHRHPDFWENPNEFDPGRFEARRMAGRHKFAYLPFGGGARMCIGSGFGLLEASLILASVTQRFKLRLAQGVEVQPQAIFVLRPNRDLKMTLKLL